MERQFKNRNGSNFTHHSLKSSEIYNNTFVANSKPHLGAGYISALGQMLPNLGPRGGRLGSIENAKSLSPSKSSIS